MALNYFKFKALLQKESWLEPAYVGVDGSGLIQYLSDHAPQNGIAIEAVEGLPYPDFRMLILTHFNTLWRDWLKIIPPVPLMILDLA